MTPKTFLVKRVIFIIEGSTAVSKQEGSGSSQVWHIKEKQDCVGDVKGNNSP